MKNKRLLITAFVATLFVGCLFSLSNLKLVKSLIDKNIEALTYTYDGVQIGTHTVFGQYGGASTSGMAHGDCGFVWSTGGPLVSSSLWCYCEIRQCDINSWANDYSYGVMLATCSGSGCSSTTYCPGNWGPYW